jgi:hypothetical protein
MSDPALFTMIAGAAGMWVGLGIGGAIHKHEVRKLRAMYNGKLDRMAELLRRRG